MTDHCQHKMKTGKRKGKPCMEDAHRTADGSHAGVQDGKAVFCHKHAPPVPPPMLGSKLALLSISIANDLACLSDVPSDVLREALCKSGGSLVEAVNKLAKLLNETAGSAPAGDDHQAMRSGVRVKGSHDPLWREIGVTT